jgi:hypothetical protein
MATTLDIPELPEQVTPAWLGSTLDHDDPAAPSTVIVKLPKKANRAVGEMLGVYEREVLFFQTFGGGFPVRIPRVYFSHYDPDAGSARQKQILSALDRLPRFLTPAIGYLGKRIAAAKARRYLVVMEDLAAFRPGDQLAGADVEDCARVLEQFAPAHAHFWGGEALTGQFWLLPMDIDARMREFMFRWSLRAFRGEASDSLRPYVDWLGSNYARLTRALTAQAPVTLVHNDLRLDNVCFDGSECAYLDWQLLRAGPAAYDVAYFLGGGAWRHAWRRYRSTH